MTVSESVPSRTERLTSGDAVLDRRLDGGIRPGTLLAIRAPPASQSEALIYTLMQNRPSLYISTIRREEPVRHDLERVVGGNATFEVASIVEEQNMDSELAKRITGGRSLSSELTDQSTTLDETFELIQSVDTQANVVIDSVTPLERFGEERMYQTVLNELKDVVMETGGLAVLHCIDHEDKPTLRERTLTIADAVWTLDPMVKSREQKYHLTVSKNRGASVVREPIELTLDRLVGIDDTRNI